MVAPPQIAEPRCSMRPLTLLGLADPRQPRPGVAMDPPPTSPLLAGSADTALTFRVIPPPELELCRGEIPAKVGAGGTGLEPATSGVTGQLDIEGVSRRSATNRLRWPLVGPVHAAPEARRPSVSGRLDADWTFLRDERRSVPIPRAAWRLWRTPWARLPKGMIAIRAWGKRRAAHRRETTRALLLFLTRDCQLQNGSQVTSGSSLQVNESEPA
jgi:hypothetical protein